MSNGDAPPLLLTGGKIFTSDADQLWAESILIDGGQIAFVGSAEEGRKAANSLSRPFRSRDIRGGAVLPGFVDAHTHLLLMGAALVKAQLRAAKSLADLLRLLVEWRRLNPSSQRVLGVGWQYEQVPGGKPTAAMLDAAFPDVPVYLDAFDLHSAWVNSAALRELGITRDTPDPVGGEIVRDGQGAATGHLQENASFTLVWPLLSAAIDDNTADLHLEAAIQAYSASGVTSAVDMALDEQALAALRRAEAAGKLHLRVAAHWLILRQGDPERELAQVERAAALAAETAAGARVRVLGVKLMVDGTIDGCTAALLEPYANGSHPDPIWDAEALTRVVVAADARHMQVALHAIGDRSVRLALDALERATAVNASWARRHRIEHLEYTDAADIPRLAPLGVTASMQPVHIDPAIHATWAHNLGPERAERGFLWRAFLDAGAELVFGSDAPTAPHEPLPNMFIAATRRSPSDATLKPHRPDQAVPRDLAVQLATRQAAWASFLHDRVGALRAGLRADVLVLDRDPFSGEPEELLRAKVVLTLLDGTVVYSDGTDHV